MKRLENGWTSFASPHAVPGDRVVRRGDLMIVDAGARLSAFQKDLQTVA